MNVYVNLFVYQLSLESILIPFPFAWSSVQPPSSYSAVVHRLQYPTQTSVPPTIQVVFCKVYTKDQDRPQTFVEKY